MATFGRNVFETVGKSIQVTADGRPEMKVAGVSVDWSVVAAVAGSDVTWLDGVTIKVGEKGLRYGQVLTRITASGKYGPYDFAAADGRQTLTPGDCYVVNESFREDEAASDHPPVLYGGHVFKGRLIATAGTHSLTNGPTYTELLAVLPRLQFVTES
jgi:hypothetical protein